MDLLQSSFVGGWKDIDDDSSISFFSPPVKLTGDKVIVTVKESEKFIPNWTGSSSTTASSSFIPLVAKEASTVVGNKSVVNQVKEKISGWTSGLPDKLLAAQANKVATYSPFH